MAIPVADMLLNYLTQIGEATCDVILLLRQLGLVVTDARIDRQDNVAKIASNQCDNMDGSREINPFFAGGL